MRSPLPRAFAAFAALCLTVVSCSDPVTVQQSRVPAGRGGLLSGVLTAVLQRTLPLAQDYSATAVIGSGGGTIRIPEAGFTLAIPAGALSAPVQVTATALQGSSVAYRLEPHGLVFARQPTITQDLSLTAAVGRLLDTGYQGGYFTDESTLSSGVVSVLEARPATFDLLRLRMSFSIAHFSGYAATKKGGYISASGNRMGTGFRR
ncbi:MAG TPA: hypothetical protein VJT67_13395 [Longimicrobiaceae bacterium]|nr:hypothetical protein [Longimicrobiaceae bacterium]